MRLAWAVLAATWLGCSPGGRGDDDQPPAADACSGLDCKVVDCAKTGRPATTVSGTVYAPNGTLALFGVTVYVPAAFPDAFPDGAHCTRCDQLSGGVVAKAVSDEMGHFTLTDVPAGTNIPLVITIGKWRRMIEIPTITACTDNLLQPGQAALPRNHAEGDIPRIALATGSCDALECLIRKLGVSDFEFSPDTGPGRIHLFASNGASKMADNTPFSTAGSLWGDLDKLKRYDLILNSCECNEHPEEKTQDMMNAMKLYADAGGRLFFSHYHNVWIYGEDLVRTHAPPVWPKIATCDIDVSPPDGPANIDTINNPKGQAFVSWMVNVMGSVAPGIVPITNARATCATIDNARAERWVAMNDKPQMFQFTTPNEDAADTRCGKVVFSDMHVSAGSTSSSSVGFPGGCSSTALTPQEKALAFMFFDIASCVGPIF